MQLCAEKCLTGSLSLTGTSQAAGLKGWEQEKGGGEAKADVCPVGVCALAKLVFVREACLFASS